MQACGRLGARMREQDVDRDIGAGIELDGGIMPPVMGDLDDPAIDDCQNVIARGTRRRESVLSNQHRLLGEDTRHRALP